MPPRKASSPDILADPFREFEPVALRVRASVLGGEFEFECGSRELSRLVEWAYKDLPQHRLGDAVPHLRISLALARAGRLRQRTRPPKIEPLSGAGMLCGTTNVADFVVISPEQRSALVVVSPEMLKYPYHTRYELIEFAVFTLAARVQGLVPLHAACVGRNGRGLLLVGDSGAGKSTAALHCVLRGLEFVSEDSVLVAPESLLATGVANFLHIRRDSVRSLPPAIARLVRRSPTIRRRSGVEKFEIDLRRPGFQLASSPVRLMGVVFVSAEQARGGALLAPVSPRAAASRLAATQPYAARQPGWARFCEQLGATTAFELRRGRAAAEAADALEGLLSRP